MLVKSFLKAAPTHESGLPGNKQQATKTSIPRLCSHVKHDGKHEPNPQAQQEKLESTGNVKCHANERQLLHEATRTSEVVEQDCDPRWHQGEKQRDRSERPMNPASAALDNLALFFDALAFCFFFPHDDSQGRPSRSW